MRDWGVAAAVPYAVGKRRAKEKYKYPEENVLVIGKREDDRR